MVTYKIWIRASAMLNVRWAKYSILREIEFGKRIRVLGNNTKYFHSKAAG